MKKLAILFIVFSLFIPSIAFADTSKSSSQENGDYPTKEEIELLNESLDKMINEANKKLENGETKIVLEEKLGNSDQTIELGFEVNDINTYNDGVQLFSSKPSGKKMYHAYVKNTAGWNFEHRLVGEFTYGGGKIKGATKDVNMTGAMYSESHNTWIDKLDPSVWEVRSHGKFKALKYLMEYNSYLTVQLLGSGDYRIARASINF
ncbi:hypothetical protein M3638_02810 [Oceanobacillus profundus]|uniref:hypothetical protein n=1 Tax=Oceanobacillus profundus TaxID=372463 RepID=UPI0020419A63|nr:hypothetical protein [Oceanobacillus profundus]MCM3396769.1 hypothetical protein [Oceanobacillus profundus]